MIFFTTFFNGKSRLYIVMVFFLALNCISNRIYCQSSDNFSLTAEPITFGIFKDYSLSVNTSKNFKIPLQTGFSLSVNYERVFNNALLISANFGGKKTFINLTNQIMNPLNDMELVEYFNGKIKYAFVFLGINSGIALDKFQISLGIRLNKSLNKVSNIESNFGTIYSFFDINSNQTAIFEITSINRVSLIEDYFFSYNAQTRLNLSEKICLSLGVLMKPTAKYSIYEHSERGNIKKDNEMIDIYEQAILFPCWTELSIGLTFKL